MRSSFGPDRPEDAAHRGPPDDADAADRDPADRDRADGDRDPVGRDRADHDSADHDRAGNSPPPTSGAAQVGRAAARVDPAHALAARLLLMLPLVIGVLLAEGIFAAQGSRADTVSVPAAIVAFLLLWQGIAWALHSWVAVLLTFVPAVMMTLGTAMVGGVEKVGGAALLIVGATMMLAIVWSRVTAPQRRWTPGWMLLGDADVGDHSAAADASHGASDYASDPDPISGRYPTSGPDPMSGPDPASDPDPALGAAMGADGAIPDGRPAPDWDTDATDRKARDSFVAELCRRGAAAGPTLASLEDFFTGNGDPRSIAPGLRGAVPLNDFRIALHALRSRRDVADVRVQLEPLEAGEYPAGQWPVAGSVLVIGTIPPDELDAVTAILRPEPAIGPLPIDELSDGDPAPDGAGEYALWWA